MTSTKLFLDALKSSNGNASDYALAKLLGVTQQTVSTYRTGRCFFSDETAIKVAELLELDSGYVIACVHSERAKTEVEKAVWSRIIRLFPKPLNDALCIMLSRWDGTERRNSARLSLC